jgi:ABC-type uncharacterized transport system permease subunit
VFPVMLILLYLSVVLYGLAALLALRFLWRDQERLLGWARSLAVGGALVALLVFFMRWWAWQRVPLTNPVDILNLFLVLCTGIVLVVQRRRGMRSLLCIYVPPLALAALLNVVLAHDYIGREPKDLRAVFLIVHVGLAYLAYALYFIASLTSIAYLIQARNLKLRRLTGLFQRMPSLEQLDSTLYALIAAGYPFFVVTLFLGLYWAWVDRELLGPQWWLSSKVVLSWIMVVFYAVSFHVRRRGLLRGPKLSYLVAGGFGGLMSLYIVAQMFNLGAHSFWQSGAGM